MLKEHAYYISFNTNLYIIFRIIHLSVILPVCFPIYFSLDAIVLVYMNVHHMVWYTCDKTSGLTDCSSTRGSISVFSRDPLHENYIQVTHWLTIIAAMCFEPGIMYNITQKGKPN